MILERLDGHGVNKPVEKSNFCDIGLLQEQLFCVFNSLDIGQKALGFHHSGGHAPTVPRSCFQCKCVLLHQVYRKTITLAALPER